MNRIIRACVVSIFLLGLLSSVSGQTPLGVTYVKNGNSCRIERVNTLVNKATESDKIIAVLNTFIQGPNAKELSNGAFSTVPIGAQIVKTTVDKDLITVYLNIPKSSLSQLNVITVDEFYDSLGKSLYGVASTVNEQNGSSYAVKVVAWDEELQNYKNLSDFLPIVPITKKPFEAGMNASTFSAQAVGQPPSFGQGRPAGFLTGKTVYVSPGHGWYYGSGSGTSSYWYSQRGNTNEIVEDFSNVDNVNDYLLPYLWNAGAFIYSCRGMSRTDNAYIIDNNDGSYSETGTWATSSSTAGYYNTGYRTSACSLTPTATAIWRPTFSKAGYYPVYIWYTVGSNRATDARITIYHAGGSTPVTLNLQHDNITWNYLGTYYFNAGNSGYVEMTNQSDNPSGFYVIADAVRFGDGKGSISRGSVTSGKYKMDECSRYWAQYMGAPSSVYGNSGADNTDDVTCRPQFAEWERETWQDPIYISWHTNAAGSGATGTEAYIWSSTWAFGQTATSDGEATAGSYSLLTCIYNQLITDIRTSYDSGWTSRGKYKNNYGELRPISSMPAALFEMAFHDNATNDAIKLKDPAFRRLVAKAVYHGIVKYYAGKAGTSPVYLPESPTDLKVVNNGNGSVTLTWKAPTTDGGNQLGHAATSYKVYRSLNGFGFDNGTVAATTTLTVSSLAYDSVYYFRVTGLNAGGESFPTETLSTRIRNGSGSQILLVYGYDQEDNWMVPKVAEASTYLGSDNGTPYRFIQNKTNDYNYAIQHAKAFATASSQGGEKYYFDSASHTAVSNNLVNMNNYPVVVWLSGRQTNDSPSRTLTSTEQTKLTTYLNAGKSLLITGSEIAYDLGRSTGTDSTFLANYLKASYVSDDAATYGTSAGSDILNGLAAVSFDDGSGDTYDVAYPDQINPVNGAVSVMEYGSGSGVTVIDSVDATGGWKDPNYSGSTDADTTSTFAIVSNPVHGGTGSGDIYYVWGTGTFIREYNSTQATVPMTASLSVWVYGDNSGHELRMCSRDTDNDLFVNNYTNLNFTGWREIQWNNVSSNASTTLWIQNALGDGLINGPNMKFDSIHLHKVSSVATGHVYIDDLTYTVAGGGGNGKVAGIKYNGTYKLIYFGFPFETITSSSGQNSLMEKSLQFLNANAVPVELSGFGMDE